MSPDRFPYSYMPSDPAHNLPDFTEEYGSFVVPYNELKDAVYQANQAGKSVSVTGQIVLPDHDIVVRYYPMPPKPTRIQKLMRWIRNSRENLWYLTVLLCATLYFVNMYVSIPELLAGFVTSICVGCSISYAVYGLIRRRLYP